MDRTYFGLQEHPFTINTDPRYLCLTQHTQEALNCLREGIEARKGFILLTGEVGTGKTTLLNKLLESLQQQGVASAFVFNPRLSAAQLFDYMLADFGVHCESRMKSRVLFKFHQWLLHRYAAGEATVLVVDEGQDLSRQALEEIRLLTNLETSTEKLLQVVIAGQPELEEKLNHHEFRPLRQRIALRAKMQPLTLEETSAYIFERLRIAGGNGEEIFSPAAIEAVHQHARGIPRIINLISEHAMIRACLAQRKPVWAEIVDDVTRDFSLDEGALLAEPLPIQRLSRARVRKHGGNSRVRSAAMSIPANHTEQPDHRPPDGITQARLPLFVYGYAPGGTPFYEQVDTIATNPRGGLISMNSPVEPGQKLLITNKETEYSQECVVEFVGARLGRGVDVAFEFSVPAPRFWRATDTDKEQTPEAEKGLPVSR